MKLVTPDERVRCHRLAGGLLSYGFTIGSDCPHDVGCVSYVIRRRLACATTIRFQLLDHQTGADVVITNMTVLPEEYRSRGIGQSAIADLLTWARANMLNDVRATQVSCPRAAHFWELCGFKRMPEPNPTGDYQIQANWPPRITYTLDGLIAMWGRSHDLPIGTPEIEQLAELLRTTPYEGKHG